MHAMNGSSRREGRWALLLAAWVWLGSAGVSPADPHTFPPDKVLSAPERSEFANWIERATNSR